MTGHAGGTPLAEISDSLGIPRSATHRLLADLREEGFVRQDFDGGAYKLTAKIVSLGLTYLSAAGAATTVLPLVEELAEATGELVVLAAIDGERLLRIAKAQGAKRGLLYNPDEGSEVYLPATSNGHAWLSCLSEEAALQLVARQGFNREGYGPNAPKTIRELMTLVRQARKLGYAKIFETYEAGTSAVAAPIVRPDTKSPIGTISVAGPSLRMTDAQLDRIAPRLIETARKIAEAGASLPIFPQHEVGH
ncbi:transcriptional regulator [Aliidongia dinghuensis]|uniref:Transcriptional regulator n=1 Tax=Aliidongia dinghuensis TaxID=1867774 RepID=A0A8J2Z1J8_9PROT|nr:transcriptional regulator [Aliidongia dinghuensis]